MRAKILLALLAMVLSLSSQAQGVNIFSSASPKLKKFLSEYPGASITMSNVVLEAFQNRTALLYYFYSDDENVARAWHYYPTASSVGLIVRENQQASDECICIMFEMLNSEGEKRFTELFDEAKAGTLTKVEFIKKCNHQEFQAVKRMRDLLAKFKLKEKEIASSYYYNRFLQCPNDFENYLTYIKTNSPQYSEMRTKEWEQMYDNNRISPSRSN